MADQRQHSGIPAGQPLQPRTEAAAQTAAAQEADQQADGRSRPRRHDADPAEALLQRTWSRQALARRGEGQEAARQTREREEARLGQGKGPPASGAGIEAALSNIASQRAARTRARQQAPQT